MRNVILSGVSALGLLAFAGMAAAQQQPSATTESTPPMQAAPAPMSPDRPAEAPATGSMGDQYRSYSGAEKGSFTGSVTGDLTAEQLLGKDVVGPDGNEIAEIADRVIEPDNTIKKVIVDVGGFLGIGAKPVALDIEQLQKPATGEDEFRTTMTKEQLEALPRYELNKGGFYVPHSGG